MQAPTTNEGALDGHDPCPACGAENPTTSTFCWRCYRAFETRAQAPGRPPGSAAWPPAPVPPAHLGHAGRPSSRLRTLGSVVGVTIGVVAAIAFATLRSPGVAFPDTLGGLERASDARSGAASDSFRAAADSQDLDADMAFYTDGGVPVAALAWIRGVEDTPGGAGDVFDTFTEDFTSGYNGSVVTSPSAERSVDGTTYVCAPIVGPVAAGICMWRDEDVFWVLMDVRPGTSIEETRALSAAAHGAAA